MKMEVKVKRNKYVCPKIKDTKISQKDFFFFFAPISLFLTELTNNSFPLEIFHQFTFVLLLRHLLDVLLGAEDHQFSLLTVRISIF